MADIERTESICSLSWINVITRLLENDGDGPLDTLPGILVTNEQDALPFRFLNLLEGKVVITGSSQPRIVSAGWTADSGIYRNPSFGKIPSEPFETKRSINQQFDRVVFRQTVGARTVSPEVMGQRIGAGEGVNLGGFVGIPVGAKVGRAVAHKLLGYPPIWTTLQLTIFIDGRSEGKVVRHSLFPSMNFYTRPDECKGQPRISSYYEQVGKSYDAVPAQDHWEKDGWGKLDDRFGGPCEGNPWGYSKDDLTMRPAAAAATRLV